MKNLIKYILILIFFGIVYSFENHDSNNLNPPFTIQQVAFDGNNINTWIYNTGIFNQDLRTTDKPGFEWPKGSGSYAVFTTGLCIAGYYNGELGEAMASYKGEYAPGHMIDSAGLPVARTDTTFKIYKVNHSDNMYTNPDWLNWGLMVPYGAPFTDVNHNGVYEPAIDTPGVHGATQTLFACLTDGFPERHQLGEGFGGGTLPLYNEVYMIAWCYDNPVIQDVQFIKWVIINKSHTSWTSTYISVVCDPDLGCANDDYLGCDTTRGLGFCYNGEQVDCSGSYRYPGIVPAVGIQWLNCSEVNNIGVKSIINFKSTSVPGPDCESDPNGEQYSAYNFMKGLKKDTTPYVIPPGGSSSYVTKFVYSGDPETGAGWTNATPGSPVGSIWNCGGPGHYSGDLHSPNPWGDRRFVMSTGDDDFTVHPGDTQKVMIAQLIAQGTSNLNSVTKLKILADTVKAFCSRGFVIGMQPISTSIPQRFELYQNYPNPFNPTTKIKFSVPILPLGKGEAEGVGVVTLKIYDILGREVAMLVNEKLSPGTYEVEWDGTNYSSGIYFYKISAGDFSETKKMVILK